MARPSGETPAQADDWSDLETLVLPGGRAGGLCTFVGLALSGATILTGALSQRSGGACVLVGVVLCWLCSVVALVSVLPGSYYLRLTPVGFTVCAMYVRRRFLWRHVGRFSVKPRYNRFGDRFKGTTVRFLVFPGPMALTIRQADGDDVQEETLPDNYGLTPDELVDLLNAWRFKARRAEGDEDMEEAPAPSTDIRADDPGTR